MVGLAREQKTRVGGFPIWRLTKNAGISISRSVRVCRLVAKPLRNKSKLHTSTQTSHTNVHVRECVSTKRNT